jgi:hypothetical protein
VLAVQTRPRWICSHVLPGNAMIQDCPRIITWCEGAFTMSGVRRYTITVQGRSPPVSALDSSKQHVAPRRLRWRAHCDKILADKNKRLAGERAGCKRRARLAQYHSNIIKFHMNIAKITPATESAKACLASRLLSNLTIFIFNFRKGWWRS